MLKVKIVEKREGFFKLTSTGKRENSLEACLLIDFLLKLIKENDETLQDDNEILDLIKSLREEGDDRKRK